MVTFIQRFGSKLNLTVHLHVLALDGAYSFQHGQARFHRLNCAVACDVFATRPVACRESAPRSSTVGLPPTSEQPATAKRFANALSPNRPILRLGARMGFCFYYPHWHHLAGSVLNDGWF
jgi:hypothetical protein